MKLSIIIPSYNAEKTLPKCIESVYKCNAAFSDFECIVINDGSTDLSENVLNTFKIKYSNFSFYTKKNEGVSIARNLGIEYATGTYVCFLDSDDYFTNNAVDIILENISCNKEDFFVFDYYEKRGKRKTRISNNINFNNESLSYVEQLKPLIFDDMRLNTCWGKIFKKDIILQHNIKFPEKVKIGEDSIFVLSYLCVAKSILLINSPLLVYNFLEGNTMSKYDLNRFNDYYLDAKTRISVCEQLCHNCSLNNICFLYIRLYFYFFISFSSTHTIKEVKEARQLINNSNFYSLIVNSINLKKIGIHNCIKFLFFVKNTFFVNVIYKLLSYAKKIKSKLRGYS